MKGNGNEQATERKELEREWERKGDGREKEEERKRKEKERETEGKGTGKEKGTKRKRDLLSESALKFFELERFQVSGESQCRD